MARELTDTQESLKYQVANCLHLTIQTAIRKKRKMFGPNFKLHKILSKKNIEKKMDSRIS